MKKGVKPDGKELKMGSYKLLTGAEKLLALDQNDHDSLPIRRRNNFLNHDGWSSRLMNRVL